MSQDTEKLLNVFERRVIRKAHGPVLVNGQWLNRQSHEIYKLYKEMDLVRNIRWRRLQWLGHVMRMKDEIVPK